MASSRQKSCGECIKAKRRCDLRIPCSRCTQRTLNCIYGNVPQLPTPPAAQDSIEDIAQANGIFGNEAAQPAFVLDPALDVGLDAPLFDPNLGSVDNIDLNFMAWQPDSENISSSTTSTSNRLRIEEILRTGADYRRADYHKTSVIWDKYTYETFSDPNSRFSCSLRAIKNSYCEFATSCQTPWLHPRLYKNGMPEIVLAVFTDCVLYANKTPANEALVYRSIENNVEKLLKPEFVESIEDHLARVQALLLYQSMRLFDTDLRQRSLAEASMETLQKWTDLLGDLRDASANLANIPGQKPFTWEAESLRRTAIAAYNLITVYYLLKQVNHERGGLLRSHPWTMSRHLWEAPSSFDFYCAWQEKPRFHLSCIMLDDFLEKGTGDDVDAFGRLLIVTYLGLDETKQWFKDTGFSY